MARCSKIKVTKYKIPHRISSKKSVLMKRRSSLQKRSLKISPFYLQDKCFYDHTQGDIMAVL